MILMSQNLALGTTNTSSNMSRVFLEVYQEDPFPEKIIKLLDCGGKQSNELSKAEYTQDSGRLLYWKLIYIPNYNKLRLHLLQTYQNIPSAEHLKGG